MTNGDPISRDLATHLGQEERDDLEFKANGDDRDLLRKAVCALANDLPRKGGGNLLVGVDKHGRPTGLTVDDDLLLKIVNLRDEGKVLPRPVLAVEKGIYAGENCVHVHVSASPFPPVAVDGTVYVRVGPSSRRASREEELRLSERRLATDLPFDQRPVVGSSIRDLDVELFRSTYLTAAVSAEVLAENDRPTEQHLSSLRLVTPDTYTPTALGLLTIGFDPSNWIPGAYMQFVRYEGEDPSSPVLDHEEVRSNALSQLDALSRLLPANLRTPIRDIGGFRQEDAPDYPLAALRELVLNAVVHRTYETSNAPTRILWFDDRVEITSPGGPYGAVTKGNFMSRNDYRNPALAAAMKQLGYVNRFGRGIGLVQRQLERNGNPPAAFAIEDTYWGVTVWSAR